MGDFDAQALDKTFSALADPTRRAILMLLMQSEARVTDLAAPFDMSLNAVSKHVRVLERAKLVIREVKGRNHFLSVDIRALNAALEWIKKYKRFWDSHVDALETFLPNRQRNDTSKV